MEGTGNKRLLNMYILDILREFSDENHALTQQEILKPDNLRNQLQADAKALWEKYKD